MVVHLRVKILVAKSRSYAELLISIDYAAEVKTLFSIVKQSHSKKLH